MARSTNCWALTAGTSAGVMKYVGDAIGSIGAMPCIGIVPVQKVRGWNGKWPGHDVEEGKLEMKQGGSESETRGGGGSTSDAELDENHSHFLFVDNPGEAGWHGELGVSAALRGILSNRHHVPVITLVIGGTIGTLEDILDVLNSEQRSSVVVVRESGGAAQAISEFIGDYCDAGGAYMKGHKKADQLRRFSPRLEELVMKTLRYESERVCGPELHLSAMRWH
jgi:hypothetical protein